MKVQLKMILTTVVLAGALAFSLTPLQGAQTPEQKGGERHSAIHAAIHSLERAKAELKSAAHDFSGHRIEAIEACDHALAQLRKTLEFDKK